MNTWRLHTGMIEAKTFRTFIKIYSLFTESVVSSTSTHIKASPVLPHMFSEVSS
jgi:hypothetical protein